MQFLDIQGLRQLWNKITTSFLPLSGDTIILSDNHYLTNTLAYSGITLEDNTWNNGLHKLWIKKEILDHFLRIKYNEYKDYVGTELKFISSVYLSPYRFHMSYSSETVTNDVILAISDRPSFTINSVSIIPSALTEEEIAEILT